MSRTTIPIPGNLGGRLRHARETAGFTREYTAVQIGRSVGAIRDWELNQRAPRMVLLAQLAQLYNVSLTDLVATERVAGDS
jgi:transcriptional regulator with XRE-family HTH domain